MNTSDPVLTASDAKRDTWFSLPAGPVVVANAALATHFRFVPDQACIFGVVAGTSGRRILVRIEQGTTGYAVTLDPGISGTVTIATTAGSVTRFELQWDEQDEAWEVISYLTASAADLLYDALGAAAARAPADADYIVKTGNGSLSAERVATDNTQIVWDFGTAGQAKLTIASEAVTFAKMQHISQYTLIGRVTSSSGDPEMITSTAFIFGLLDDSDAATARGTLGLGTIATKAIIAAQADSTATDVAGVKADLNALLAAMRTSGAMAT